MVSKYKTIQISFNLSDPFQKKLYDYVKSMTTNFSSYGKYLIQKDMENSWNKNANNVIIQDANEIELEEDILRSFI